MLSSFQFIYVYYNLINCHSTAQSSVLVSTTLLLPASSILKIDSLMQELLFVENIAQSVDILISTGYFCSRSGNLPEHFVDLLIVIDF